MSTNGLILVTGAAGRIGGVGRSVVELLRRRNLPVRALVRTDDERADALRATGAEVVMGDLTQPVDVARAVEGVQRMFFGMSVSASYLEATAIAAAVARERAGLEVFVNISQLTVSREASGGIGYIHAPPAELRANVARFMVTCPSLPDITISFARVCMAELTPWLPT